METGTARDAHHFACLIGYGATAVYPYLAYQTLFDLMRKGAVKMEADARQELGRSYRRGIHKGLFKIMSKMGISHRRQLSQRAAVRDRRPGRRGGRAVLRRHRQPHQGADFARSEERCASIWRSAPGTRPAPVEQGGLLKYMHGGEYHMYNPDVVATLQSAVMTGDYEQYRQFAALGQRPAGVHPARFAEAEAGRHAHPIEEVEPISAILPRFDSAGMSLGALSPEAHEALAIAMNRLGARSNSGEGGEDPARYGTEKNSKIKQVASGRFGVTPEYLINAEVLQIKVAQGAKPGEGGQLPATRSTT